MSGARLLVMAWRTWRARLDDRAAATRGAGLHGRPALALLLVAGVVAGSAAWWLMLPTGVSLLRSRFDARAMRWVNRISAAVIGAFGLAALGTALAEGGR